MTRRYLIIDCFVDEPACFGVPPFVSPYPRYIFGALIDGGISPDSIEYLTVEELRRRDFRLDRDYDWAFIVGGAVVPGKYLGSRIGTLAEIGRIIERNGSQPFAVGGLAARVVPPGENTLPVAGDIEFFAHGAARGEAHDGARSVKDIARWSVLGAPMVMWHPDHPHLICEMETYRGCPRSSHCSFCSEGSMGGLEFRDAGDILAEVEALERAGITRFRLGRQADILQYGSALREWRGGFPRPEPAAIRRLFGPLAAMKRNGRIRVLNVDNANPGTIANFPDESSEIINCIAGAVTPGDTLALGVESFDEAVIAGNALKIAPGQVLTVVRIINEAGGMRVDGIPALLPGINLLHGLHGESQRTFEVNYRRLCEIRDSGLLLRRINIRKVQPFPGTPLFENRPRISRSLEKRFEYYRDRIRNDIDIPMMKRVFPAGTIIRESMIQEERTGYSYGKQIASYSVTAKIPLPIAPGSFIDAVVVDHRERSLLALPLPLSLNQLPQKALAMIRGVGNKRATEIIIRRPVKSMDDIKDVLVDVDPAVRRLMVM